VPEGDTIHRVATVLRRALGDRTVTAFEAVAPRVTSDARRFEIVGSVVRAVESNGKHLLITFARGGDDVVLHTHMKMTGMWHVYRPGERWWEPRRDARVVITTDAFVAPCFRPPVVELMTTREIALHAVLPRLGPDIIRDEFDADEAVRRLRESPPDRDIATALLDQRTISGIGNVFKCEALFLERVSPWAKASELDDDTLRRLVAQARTLMRRNRDGGERRTRFTLNGSDLMWVDERTGQPCHVCGTPIAWGYHPNEFRKSWYCPRCQNVGTAGPAGAERASGAASRSSRTPAGPL
jgi:endonuclease-8